MAKQTIDVAVVANRAVCLRWRSTKVPKNGLSTADEMLKAPPMTPVATTDRVSRYTQKVSANQRNVLVTLVTNVLASSCRKTRGAPVATATRPPKGPGAAPGSLGGMCVRSRHLPPCPPSVGRAGCAELLAEGGTSE